MLKDSHPHPIQQSLLFYFDQHTFQSTPYHRRLFLYIVPILHQDAAVEYGEEDQLCYTLLQQAFEKEGKGAHVTNKVRINL